jgi:hypothetical protein
LADAGCDSFCSPLLIEQIESMRQRKDLSRLLAGIIEKANPSRVGEAPMLEIENQMRAPVRQGAVLWGSAH